MDAEVLKLIQWTIGLCSTGFLFLAGWVLWLVQRVKERPTFKDLKEEVNSVNTIMREIRDALLGDMQHEGLISRQRRMQERCVIHKIVKDHVDEPMGTLK